MKNTFRNICLIMASSCVFFSCNEKIDTTAGSEQEVKPILVEMTFTAESGFKTVLDGTDILFQENDAISILDGENNNKFTAGLAPKYASEGWPAKKVEFTGAAAIAENYVALYPYTEDAALTDGNITGVVVPSEQVATAGTFDPAANASVCVASKSGVLSLLNVGAYFKFNVPSGSSYSKVEIISNTTEPIAGTLTVDPDDASIKSIQNASNKVTMTNIEGGNDYYFVILPGCIANGITLKFYSDATTLAGTKVTRKAISIERTHVKSLGTVTPGPTPSYETIPGDYSISLTQKVRFAKGNLQYQASTGKWRIAEHQWIAYRATADGGNTTSSGRDTQEKWIDMFGWGATGVNGNTAPYLASTTESDYISEDLSVSGNKADWGYVASGNKSDYWFTLSRDEWTFLAERENREQSDIKTEVSYAWITVEGYDGFIYFPDGWKKTDWPSDVPEPTYFNDSSKSRGTYTAAQFQKLEDKGIVFFPATDYRDGTSIKKYDSNTYGYYWTRTLGGVSSGKQTGNSFAIGYGRNPLSGAVVGPNIPRTHDLLITYGHAVRLVMIPEE